MIDPSVPTAATVDLKLTQVPWDQVMDVVLKTGQLTYQIDGPVVRVLTREARTKELEDEAQQKTRERGRRPTSRRVHRKLNYAHGRGREEAARRRALLVRRAARSTSTSARTC